MKFFIHMTNKYRAKMKSKKKKKTNGSLFCVFFRFYCYSIVFEIKTTSLNSIEEKKKSNQRYIKLIDWKKKYLYFNSRQTKAHQKKMYIN